MSDVERLEAELELARLTDRLEETREAMHADRNEETVASYREASNAVAAARSAFRERWRVEAGPDDAAPMVETIASKGAVNE